MTCNIFDLRIYLAWSNLYIKFLLSFFEIHICVAIDILEWKCDICKNQAHQRPKTIKNGLKFIFARHVIGMSFMVFWGRWIHFWPQAAWAVLAQKEAAPKISLKVKIPKYRHVIRLFMGGGGGTSTLVINHGWIILRSTSKATCIKEFENRDDSVF